MRCNAFVEAWKNHHRRASMILGLSLLSAPLSYSVYAEDGVSNTMVQVVTQTKTVKGTIIDESGEPLIGVSIVVKGTQEETGHGRHRSARATLFFLPLSAHCVSRNS